MLWIKAFHIIFVIGWFAGLFYLPRLFMNTALSTEVEAREQLMQMARKLFVFMTHLAVLAIILGMVLWKSFGIDGGWLHAKIMLVVALVGYHSYCWKLMRDLALNKNIKHPTWYRWFNEVPALLLIAIVILVVVKPF